MSMAANSAICLLRQYYLLLVPKVQITAILINNNWCKIGIIPNEIIKKESA